MNEQALGVETQAQGRVMDIRPLLDLRARYRGAQSELAIVDAALKVSKKNHDRLEKLHSESIVATRDLLLAESQLAADQARQAAAQRHVRETGEEALQSFGVELFRQAVAGDSPLLEDLLQRTQVLVLIALPAGQSLQANIRAVAVNPSGERDKARQARLIAAAPRTEESTQGETWFFAADSRALRTGMRLDAWIPQAGKLSRGVLIPLSAVVWRDGQPWVYVKTGAESFNRRHVGAHSEQGESWFATEGFAAGEEVVVVGGQMLLSEEQRRNSAGGEDDD